jgi:Transposase DDE domain
MPTPRTAIRVSVEPLIDRLFQFIPGRQAEHRRFLARILTALLQTHSPWLSNLARALHEGCPLIQTEKKLSRLLGSKSRLPWSELDARATELGCHEVKWDDVIAFDPGDLIKEYAEKMDYLYRVHDGSRDQCGWGYEEFAVEAIQWRAGHRFHIPLYEKLTNASIPSYHSQNAQILDAIQAVYSYLGENRGIWTFDRGHDRGHLFTHAFLSPKLKFRWILRLKENRSVEPENPAFRLPRQYHAGIFDIVRQIKLTDQPLQLRFPQVTAPLYIGWHRVRLASLDLEPGRWFSLVIVHDRRNKNPVVLLSNLEVQTPEQALVVFGYYLERWRKEEGYRFLKTALHLERIRTLRWERIERLAWLEHLAYFYLTLFYRSAPERIDSEMNQRLRHFVPLEKVSFRYYRIAQLVQILLAEQRGAREVLEPLPEVA